MFFSSGVRRIVFFPGSFDPFTNGHLDIVRRSLGFADKLVIGIGIRQGSTPLFTVEERVHMIRGEIESMESDIDIVPFPGLAVDAARAHGAKIILRGLRDSTDFDYEMRMARMNSTVSGDDIQTVFLPASHSVACIASSLVRQIALMGGDVSPFVPSRIAYRLEERYKDAISMS